MTYAELDAPEELRPVVAVGWHFRVHAGAGEIEHFIPPDGSLSFFANRQVPELLTMGPRTSPHRTVVRGGDVVWGLRLWPGTIRAVLPGPVERWRGYGGPIDDERRRAWGRTVVERLREAETADEAMRAWVDAFRKDPPDREALDPLVTDAVFEIIARQGVLSVAELPARAGVSPRQFRRRFRAGVGLSAKELARVRRLRASLVGALFSREETWAGVAAAHGYADQAHLIGEYRRVVGLPPEALRAHLDRIRHERVVDR